MSHSAELSPLSRGLLTAGVAGMALSGCAAAEYAALPDGDCDQNYLVNHEPRPFENAQECLSAYAGRLIIVDFANDGKAHRTAEAVEELLPSVTNGLVHPTIDVIQASAEAEDNFQQAQSDGCEKNDPTEYAAFAAASTMSGLSEYNGIIALHGGQVCGEGSPGATYAPDNRLADVETQRPKGQEYADRERNFTTAHEILHLYGLGHAGRKLGIVSPNEVPKTLLGNSITAQSGALLLEEYAQSAPGEWFAYEDDSSIMGGNADAPPEDLRLHPVHQAMLTEADSIVNDAPLQMPDATEQPVTIKATEIGMVAEVKLAEPVSMTEGADDNQATYRYSSLAVVPISKGGEYIEEAEIVLMNAAGDYVTLGPLVNRVNRGGVFEIIGAGNIITLTFGPDQLTVSNNQEQS